MKRRAGTLVIVGVVAMLLSATIGCWMQTPDDVHQLSFCNVPHPSSPQSRPAPHRAISAATAGIHFTPQLASFASGGTAVSGSASAHRIAFASERHAGGARRLSLIATLRI